MSRTVIQLDPYFDGPEAGATHKQDDSNFAYTPHTARGYQDAGAVLDERGVPLTGRMRPGPEGVRGTVIPSATMHGVPRGVKPHDVADIKVVIDPQIPNQSSVVRLGDITEDAVMAATNEARQMVPEPVNPETARLMGAAILHNIAAHSKERVIPEAGDPHQLQQAGYPMQPQQIPPQPQAPQGPFAPQQPMQAPAPQKRVSPLTAFNQANVQQTAAPQAPQAPVPQPAPVAPAQPTIGVTFEAQGFGNIDSHFHDVIVEDNFIVFLYDTSTPGQTPYFPQAPPANNEGEAPPMACQVHGHDDVAYLIQPVGLTYQVQGVKHCVVIIQQSFNPNPDQE